MQRLLTIIAGVGGIYYLVVASRLLTFFGIFIPPQQHRAISLSLALILIFLLGSTHLASAKKRTVQWYDVALLVAGLLGTGFVALFQEQVMEYEDYAFLDLKGTVLAFLLAIVLLEAVRRATNIVLPLLIAFFLLAASFQNYLPGLLRGPDVSVDRLTYTFYTGSAGVFGIPLGIASGILVIFLIFGRLLQQAGGGKWFLDLALAITGRVSGGPAKAAVTASFFFGMISGSPSANTATTGAITIPLMKSTGYKSTFAGAVEAVSSTGGQIMPPVMGAIAFIMAEWLGIDYVQVVIAAFVPAIIYFLIVFASVHFETKRQAIPVIPQAQIPPLIPTIVRGWFYLPPLVTLVYVLIVMRYPPDMAGLAAISVLIGFSMFSKEKEQRLYPKRLFDGLALGIKGWLTVASVTAAVGMLIGAMELTGLGVKFSSFMLDISGGNLLLTLALVGIASLILGMGL
ncbi:MAG: TRAP transporter permease, partial [Dehalococcoidia bacterium]